MRKPVVSEGFWERSKDLKISGGIEISRFDQIWSMLEVKFGDDP